MSEIDFSTPFDAVSIEDRLRIQDQMARYSWAFDAGDLEHYLDRFWQDGVLEHPKRDGSHGRFEGHEGIRTFLGDFTARPDQTWGHQHQFSSVFMERPEENFVQVRAYAAVLRHEFHRTYWPTGAAFRLGTWHALFERRDNDWRMALLQIRMWTDQSLGDTGKNLLPWPDHAPGTR